MSNIAKELTDKDRPLKNMPAEDLRVLSSTLQEAISNAKFCGLHATADKLEAIRGPILTEYRSRLRLPRGPRSPYSSSENR